MPFSSGGTTEILAGAKIKGATSGALAYVKEILAYSGTWAAGSIAGFFVVDMIYGTFGSENVYVVSDTTAGIGPDRDDLGPARSGAILRGRTQNLASSGF